MDKKELTKRMSSQIGDFPNTSELAEYFNISRAKVRELVDGLEYWEKGRNNAKSYYVGEVAERWLARRITPS